MAASLAQIYNDCETCFERLLGSLKEQQQDSDKTQTRILDQHERFQIWAGNIGARQASMVKTSLDWRVREAPKLKHQIGELLEDLTSAIEELTSITSGQRPNRTSSPLSVEDGAGSEYEGFSEVDELAEMLSESITGLFKISLLIQRATPRDRFIKAQSSTKDPFNPAWDILHVGHKFPELGKDDTQWLQRKFGLANAQRRQFFRYARQHREKKETVKEVPVTLPDIVAPEVSAPLKMEIELPETQTILSSQKPASSFAHTTASTLAVAKLQSIEQESDDDAMSHTSFATSVNEAGDPDRLRVPRLQDISHGQNEFECPYCYTIVKPKSHNQWKKHVFEDLRPYICTFEGCDVKLFSDRRSWFEHESQNHRVAYHCRFCSHRAYNSEQELQKHLSAQHSELCLPNTIPSILQASQESQDSFEASECPCCIDWEKELRQLNAHIPAEDSIYVTGKQFRNHLANHQEQLALFALPKHYDDEGEIESAGVAASDNSVNLSDVSLLSGASSTKATEERQEKLFREIVRLLDLQRPSDNDLLLDKVKWLTLYPRYLDELFSSVIMSTHPLREELIRFTLGGGANVKQLVYGNSPLYIASEHMSLDLLQILLDSGADIAARNEVGVTAIYFAAQQGWIDGFRLLINAGADVNAPSDSNGNRPIHAAVQTPNRKLLQILLDAGAVLSQTNAAGRTALHVAVEFGNIEGIETLLANDIYLNGTDSNRRTALHDAVSTAHEEIVALLLSYSADPNTMDRWSNCPLVSAVEKAVMKTGKCPAIVRHLLDAGASIHLWRSKIDDTTLRLRVARLISLQQVLEELDGPVTVELQDYIEEAKAAEVRATQAGRGHIVYDDAGEETEVGYAPRQSFPQPTSAYWWESEASQLEYLELRRKRYGHSHAKFLDTLEMLGALYQDWMMACNQAPEFMTASESTTIKGRLFRSLKETSIDLWINQRLETAQELMADIIQNCTQSTGDAKVTSSFNVITAIAAALKTTESRTSPWRRTLRDSDWKQALLYRDSIEEKLGKSILRECSKCPGFDFWDDTIYSLHLTWHSDKEGNPANQQNAVPAIEIIPSSLYSGPMIYGVLNFAFKAERIDELAANAGESIMILARSNHDWFLARSITRPGEPGLLPIGFVDVRLVSSGRSVLDVQEAINDACLPTVEEWKTLDSVLKLRSSARRTQVYAGNPIHAEVSRVRISNRHDLYRLHCQMGSGPPCIFYRFYLEFYELHVALLQRFPDEAKEDEHGGRILPYFVGPALSDERTDSINTYLKHLLALSSVISRSIPFTQFFSPGFDDSILGIGEDGQQILDANQNEKTIQAEKPPLMEQSTNTEGIVTDTGDLYEKEPASNPPPTPDQRIFTKLELINNAHTPMSKDTLYDTLVTGLPGFNIKLGPRIGRKFVEWLIHVYALDLQEAYQHIVEKLLQQLSIRCSNQQEFDEWLSKTVCQYLELRHTGGPFTYSCRNCGRKAGRLWSNQEQYKIDELKSTVKLCIPCILSMNLLNVRHTSDQQQFAEWIIPEILDRGSAIINMSTTETDIELPAKKTAFLIQKLMIEYGMNLLDVTASSWQSSGGEKLVASWIWFIILMRPGSYVMTRQEMDLFERNQPEISSEYHLSIKKAAIGRYKAEESSQAPGASLEAPSPPSLQSEDSSPLSFLFTIIDIEMDYNIQSRQTWKKRWLPPDVCDGIKPSVTERPLGNIYRWWNGVIYKGDKFNPVDHNLTTSLDAPSTFSTCTVVMDESKAFACVPFDARRVEVRSSEVREWQYLGFDHVYNKTRKDVLSKVVAPGQMPRLAGYKEDESSWIRDLFPGEYRSAVLKAADKTKVSHHGLIGSLGLIMALASFTAPSHKLDETLKQSFQAGRRWQSTGEVSHARLRRRGVVVSIWEDLSVPNPCNKQALRNLEAGLLGPIISSDTGAPNEAVQDSSTHEISLPDRQRKSKVDVTAIIGGDSSDRFSRSGISKTRTETPASRIISISHPPPTIALTNPRANPDEIISENNSTDKKEILHVDTDVESSYDASKMHLSAEPIFRIPPSPSDDTGNEPPVSPTPRDLPKTRFFCDHPGCDHTTGFLYSRDLARHKWTTHQSKYLDPSISGDYPIPPQPPEALGKGKEAAPSSAPDDGSRIFGSSGDDAQDLSEDDGERRLYRPLGKEVEKTSGAGWFGSSKSGITTLTQRILRNAMGWPDEDDNPNQP